MAFVSCNHVLFLSFPDISPSVCLQQKASRKRTSSVNLKNWDICWWAKVESHGCIETVVHQLSIFVAFLLRTQWSGKSESFKGHISGASMGYTKRTIDTEMAELMALLQMCLAQQAICGRWYLHGWMKGERYTCHSSSICSMFKCALKFRVWTWIVS